MKNIALVLLVLPIAASASDYAEREKTGKAALASAEAKNYQTSWGPALASAMHSCIPVGSENPANEGKFAFVANINSSGDVSSVAVRPATKVSTCFAQHFGAAKLQPPPASLLVSGVLPVADTINVVP